MLVKAATVMFVYALAMIGVGWVTFHVSPPGSKAITALVVPGVLGIASIVCAVLTLMGSRGRGFAMTGVHIGLLIPILGAAGSFMRLGGSLSSAEEFNARLKETGAVIVAEDSKQPVKNSAYQAVGLASVGALSVVAFVSLLAHRPKVPKATEAAADYDGPEKERLSPSQD